jgi:hypothetical protein
MQCVLLKQGLEGLPLDSSEEMVIAIHEWLRMQSRIFERDDILELVKRWNK